MTLRLKTAEPQVSNTVVLSLKAPEQVIETQGLPLDQVIRNMLLAGVEPPDWNGGFLERSPEGDQHVNFSSCSRY